MIIIAIDGPAGSGKGTVGRRLADEFDFAYLDTGLLYRGIGYLFLKNGVDPSSEVEVKHYLEALSFQDLWDSLQNPILRTEEVGIAASKASAYQVVRDKLLDLQRNFAHTPPDDKQGAILDGRDIGTVICPDAQLKLFITADLEVRAKRRFFELKEKLPNVVYEDVLADIKSRDERDSKRTLAPLKPADDAIVLNTSHMSTNQVFDFCMLKVRELMA